MTGADIFMLAAGIAFFTYLLFMIAIFGNRR
jgi:hypothetical protein